jgi:hypothetical protein
LRDWTIEEAGVSFAFAPPCRAPESQEILAFNVSRGSRRKAVPHNAALSPCPPKEKHQIKKLIPVVSWIGFLASAVSEYGLGIDFPLTPPVWLMIAVCAVMMATAHAAIGNRIHSLGKRETGTYLSSHVLLKMAPAAVSGPTRHADFWAFVVGRACPPAAGKRSHGDPRLGDVIVTASNAIPAIIFLNPAATRGPPGSDNQIDRPLGRPAQQPSTALPPFEIHFSSRNSLTIKTSTGEPA